MKKMIFFKLSIAAVIVLSFAACKKTDDTKIPPANQSATGMEEMISEKDANPDEAAVTENTSPANVGGREGHGNHYLYTESNSAATNEILVFKIKPDGAPESSGVIASGGAGTGKSLGSQGALVIDQQQQWLYAVNAGANSVSSFKIEGNGNLRLAHTASVNGTTPVSVTVHDNLLYVLNRGSDNIQGFKIGGGGKLTAIEGSMQPLSSTGVDAPQISFTPDGDQVLVTEKATNTIGTFKVASDGSVSKGIFTASTGPTPFGFDFSRGYMIVSNAAGGAAGAGSATSYSIGNGGIPRAVNGAVASQQAAPCWVATTKYGRFAYITNTASNSISSYYVTPWGALYLVLGAAAKTGMNPVDIVVGTNNYDVYELNSKSNTIGWYQRKLMGELEFKSSITNLPVSATGLATY
ncbi:MAG: lactonase family protein [Ferruginibacter sp.]|uniref:lactonase family protein n=1 Tax=Ferruginibacter sp. TaxID=1940288 RepID=UPI00265B3A2E|nr:beta-propeller fold lactonase family protein [Ferruginibacter sp.]MDB5279075.1 lactonase family protein [Ferruginibacter sp.]